MTLIPEDNILASATHPKRGYASLLNKHMSAILIGGKESILSCLPAIARLPDIIYAREENEALVRGRMVVILQQQKVLSQSWHLKSLKPKFGDVKS